MRPQPVLLFLAAVSAINSCIHAAQYPNHTTLEPPHNCGRGIQYIYTSPQNISSPNFPGFYNGYATCVWDFESSPGTVIEVAFGHFDVRIVL